MSWLKWIMAFAVGFFACKSHGTYWLYTLLIAAKTKRQATKSQLGFVLSYVLVGVIGWATVTSFLFFMGNYGFLAFYEKTIILLMILFAALKEDSRSFILCSRAPVALLQSHFAGGFLMGMDEVLLNGFAMVVYFIVIDAIGVRAATQWTVAATPLGLLGAGTAFFILGKRAVQKSPYNQKTKEALHNKAILLLLMGAGLFL